MDFERNFKKSFTSRIVKLVRGLKYLGPLGRDNVETFEYEDYRPLTANAIDDKILLLMIAQTAAYYKEFLPKGGDVQISLMISPPKTVITYNAKKGWGHLFQMLRKHTHRGGLDEIRLTGISRGKKLFYTSYKTYSDEKNEIPEEEALTFIKTYSSNPNIEATVPPLPELPEF